MSEASTNSHLVPRDPQGLETVLHVLGAGPYVLDVPAQLIVDVGVPIGEEYDELETGVDEVLDLLGADHPSDVHQSGRLEADITPGSGLGSEQGLQFLCGDYLLGVPGDQLVPFVWFHVITAKSADDY